MVSPEKADVPESDGIIYGNESFGFDFPATRSLIRDIGSLTVHEAIISLRSMMDAQGEVIEAFGVKLPIGPSLALLCSALPVLAAIFLAGFSAHGIQALPEAAQDIPGWMAGLSVFGTVCVLPAYSLFVSGSRLEYALPLLAEPLQIAGLVWLIVLTIITIAIYFRRRSFSPAKGS